MLEARSAVRSILGATVETVPLRFSSSGWNLDLQELIRELRPGTKALYLNSPKNPTGWTITREDQKTILGHCRKHGIWIFADDAYERIYFGPAAPCFGAAEHWIGAPWWGR